MNKNKCYYIYGLHLEGDAEIRYVGCTKNLNRRIGQHKKESITKPSPKGQWIANNVDKIKVKIITTTIDDPKLLERKTISRLTKEGHRLFNIRRPRMLKTEESQALLHQWLNALD